MRVAKLLLLPVMLGVALGPSLAGAQQKPESKTTASPAPSQTAVPETPSPSSTPDPDKIYRPGSEGLQPPSLINGVQPKYPKKAIKAKKEGMVILEGVIDRDGIVRNIRVLNSVDPLLDAAAKKAVEQWRYRPATKDGVPVNVYLNMTVTFNLTRK